jgi:hypothetical protein
VALVGGVLGWVFALMTLRWSMSFMALLALVALRVGRREKQDTVEMQQDREMVLRVT